MRYTSTAIRMSTAIVYYRGHSFHTTVSYEVGMKQQYYASSQVQELIYWASLDLKA